MCACKHRWTIHAAPSASCARTVRQGCLSWGAYQHVGDGWQWRTRRTQTTHSTCSWNGRWSGHVRQKFGATTRLLQVHKLACACADFWNCRLYGILTILSSTRIIPRGTKHALYLNVKSKQQTSVWMHSLYEKLGNPAFYSVSEALCASDNFWGNSHALMHIFSYSSHTCFVAEFS